MRHSGFDPEAVGALARSRRIAAGIRERLLAAAAAAAHGEETLLDPDDLKSAHAIDAVAREVIVEAFRDVACNIRIEGEPPIERADARFCIYVDPVDGSLNWDRGIGDPAFVLAIAPGAAARRLDDLSFACVEGLRSGDRYWTGDDGAWFRSAATGHCLHLRCNAPARVEAATGYLRCGYGGARRQLEHTLSLFLAARDLRAVDNAGTELAEIARNAAHFQVEARGISDGYNLLAWPIVRAAGGVLLDLEGGDIARRPFDPDQPVDYVIAGSRDLAAEIVRRMARDRAAMRECLDRLGH